MARIRDDSRCSAGTLALWLPPLSRDDAAAGAGRVDRAHLRAARLDRGGAAARRARSRAARNAAARSGRSTDCRSRPPATCTCTCANAARLQDALTAVRHSVTLAEAGARLFPNGERHLREPRAAREALPARAARRNREDRGARELLARRAALRISARAGAGGRNAGFAPAQARRSRCAPALAAGRARKACARRSTTSSRSSPTSNTSPTSSRCTTS